MNVTQETSERLKFLIRVVGREVNHLAYADNQVFDDNFTYKTVENLDNAPELAMKVEAFVSRFCRLQDTLGDKLLPTLLKALGEPDRALLINLEKAEKYGWLASSEQWVALRQLRNQMIHEYIEDAQILFDALIIAHDHQFILEQFAKRLDQQVQHLLVKK